MARREISKHSRAARRAQADEPESKELSKLPRVSDKADMASYIVRTANRNEELLRKKLEKKKIAGKRDGPTHKILSTGGITKSNSRVTRALAFDGKLSKKIERSKNRGRTIQNRRTTWEQVNAQLKNLDAVGKPIIAKPTGSDDKKMDIEEDDLEELEEDDQKTQQNSANRFSLLEEIEA